MRQAFVIGLVISVIWSLTLAGLFGYVPDPLELGGRGLGAALLAIVLFIMVSQSRHSGYLGISLALVFVLFLGGLFVIPLAQSATVSLLSGDADLMFVRAYELLFDPYYWNYRFNDPYSFIPTADLPIIALVVTISTLRGAGSPEAAMTQGLTSSGNANFAGLARRHDWSEINRLFLAHAWTGGSSFRRSVIDRAEESFNAPALEVGLDMERLVKLCLWREGKETGYRVVLLLLLIAGFFGLIMFAETENPALLVLVLLVAAVMNGGRRAGIYANAHRLYGFGNFSPDQATEAETVSLSDEQSHGLPPAGQNVVVYSGFTPFEFAGIAVGGWSVSVDTSRASSGIAAAKEATPFTEGELRSFITDRLQESQIQGLSVHDLVVAQGADAPDLPASRSYRGVSQPRVQLDAEEMDRLPGEHPNTFRRYVWISVRDWGGELLVSAFWRCALKDHMLQVELRHFLLTPVGRTLRRVDTVRADWRHSIAQFLAGAILSPVVLVGGPLMLLGHLQIGLARLLGSEKRARAKAIKLKPRYNFGAAQSLRVQLMGIEFLHYFQKMDHEHYQRSLDKILLESLVSFLEDHGVDTADLKETQTAIFNSGVIVQGGDITAQSLAVGERAKASTGIVGRALGRRGAASGSAKKS